ncbi:MAG: ABC transporter substrate-binding protein [Acidobacteria bacterium]|nr:ABC transporter substrate-binding protein [Acidobacteriota bacterium]
MRPPKGRAFLLLFLSLLVVGTSARSDPRKTVVVVKSRNLVPYNQAVEGLKKTFASREVSVQIREVELPSEPLKEETFLRSIEKSQPDLVVTVGTQATLSVIRHIKGAPVVFSLVLFSGESESLLEKRPANVTGAAMDIPIGHQFQRLREIIPDLKRVGVIFNPLNSMGEIEQARRAARDSGLTLVEIPVTSESEVLQQAEGLKGRVDVLWSVADSTVFTPRSVDSILLLTLRDGIPFVGLSPSFVKAGALLSFSCDYEDVGSQSAEQALEILAGKPPAEVSVVFPRRISLFLNLNTARAIHLEISQKLQSQVEFVR